MSSAAHFGLLETHLFELDTSVQLLRVFCRRWRGLLEKLRIFRRLWLTEQVCIRHLGWLTRGHRSAGLSLGAGRRLLPAGLLLRHGVCNEHILGVLIHLDPTVRRCRLLSRIDVICGRLLKETCAETRVIVCRRRSERI